MNVEIGTEAPIFLFWKYLFQIFGILSLQCGQDKAEFPDGGEDGGGEGVFGKAKTIFNVGGRNKKHLNVAYNEQLHLQVFGLGVQGAADGSSAQPQDALKKKKIKFSSYIRKFRMECGYLYIIIYIKNSYMYLS